MPVSNWIEVDGWPGYEVSDDGRVRSWKLCRRSPDEPLPRDIRPWVLPNGYAVVTLKERGRRKNVYIHQAVARAFIGPRPEGMEVAHGDGNQQNNTVANLRYASPKDNSADTVAHGHTQAGDRHYAATVTDDVAHEIRAFTGTHAEAARSFGIGYHVAYRIRTGRTWRRA